MVKYRVTRIPIEAWQDILRKKQLMENDLKNITGKVKRIPATRVIRVVAKQAVYLDKNELLNLAKVKRVKKCEVY